MSDNAPTRVPTVPGLVGLSVLARGGYATVFRAIQQSVGREVAVKVENRTLESEKDRRRFLREAKAAGRMSSHPHVVDLFDVGVTPGGRPYLIMELCDGNYADRMKSAPLTHVEARWLGARIADALAGAHKLGVVHRDVKPANLLITKFGEPALADFGLAVLAESRDTSITLELTPAYAAPELFHHRRPVPASDVYGLCATLYALMRGRPPRWRDGHNPTLVSLVDMFAEPVPDLPGVPSDLTVLLRRGMSNDLRLRPTAEHLRDALAGVARDPDPTMVLRGLTSIDPGAAPSLPSLPSLPTQPGTASTTYGSPQTVPNAPQPVPNPPRPLPNSTPPGPRPAQPGRGPMPSEFGPTQPLRAGIQPAPGTSADDEPTVQRRTPDME